MAYSAPVRISGGVWRGRSLRSSGGGAELRPTQDRVREALFSILGEMVVDCRFLDLFAGSGAVGLEAASRGARHVTWVECRSAALALLRQNVASLESRGQVVRERVASFLQRTARQGAAFDVAFADPPYIVGRNRPRVEELVARGQVVLAPGGLFVLEQDRAGAAKTGSCRDLVDRRRYGDTVLSFFRAGTEGGGA